MRTDMISTSTTYTAARVTALLLLLACLGACDRTSPQGASPALAATTAPASLPARAGSDADAALAVAVARESAARAAREQTLRVQQHLRDQQRAHEMAQRGDGHERCLAGQKMRRVANGWVQAGTC